VISKKNSAFLTYLRHRMGMNDVVALGRTEVYEKYAEDLVRFATGLVGPTDSQDVVSTAVMGAMWSTQWSSVRNQRSYLFKAVLNQARMHYRGTMRRRARELRSLDSGGAGSPEIRLDVLEAVKKLGLQQRAVIFLAYWEDLPGFEIARRLGLHESTVRRHLKKAEARLRRILDV